MDPHRIYRDFASDVLVNILGRLPPKTRRRLRLVCRHWRHIVDRRTPTDMRSRAKTLVVATGSAYVLNDLSAPGKIRGLWSNFHTARRFLAMSAVGTCNGLVCLCDGREPGGAITVANPVTGEALTIPPLPMPPPCTVTNEQDIGSNSTNLWHQAYSFVYLQTTERYKIVHVPCQVDRFVFDAVHMFTLGEPSWRAIPVGPATRCDPGHGVVSVDAASATATYWATPEGTAKVMSFDLEDERVTSIMPLPSVLSNPKEGSSWHLAEVQGRLGIVVRRVSSLKTEVWVMEDDDRRTFGYIETKEPLSVFLHAGGSTCVISWDWNP
ncbi:hypothetical protein VPH35_135647 [Triticum aestivum]